MAPDVLVNTESLHDFDYDHFPPCWQSLCTEWEGKDLGKFGHVAKKTSRWGRKIASGWFKRKSGYDQIERTQSVFKLKTTHSAAKFLDDRRVHVDKLPLGKHVEKIVKEDPSKQKRVRTIKPKQPKPTIPSRQETKQNYPQ
jgi:phage anti-repressor protein